MQQALVDLAKSGDEEAFTVLARAAGDQLLSIAFRILRDLSRAEDAVQQTLVIAWRELPSLRDSERFDAWLRRLLVNACYAEARAARSWRANVRLLPTEVVSTSDELLTVALRDQLERAFRRISPEQRAVFVFHHYMGFNVAEIADELSVPIGTVKSRLHYATSALRAAVEADGRSNPTPAERPA